MPASNAAKSVSAPYSIHEALLGRQADTAPGATSLIRDLLRAAANIAVDSQSDTLTAYSIVKLAREACEKIDATIESIDTEEDEDRAWGIFEQYVNAIRKLEGHLLDSDTLLEKVNVNFDVSSVSGPLANIPIWEQNRAGLQVQLQKLRALNGDPSASAASTWEQRRDDVAVFHMMIDSIPSESRQPTSARSQAVELLKGFLPKLDDATPPNPEVVVYAIKAAWLIRAALQEKEGENTPEPRKYHLESQNVWNKAKTLCEKVASGSTEGLKAVYDEFIKVMQVRSSPPLNKSYISLIRASSNVTRPFIYRNKILIEFTRDLVKLFNDARNIDVKSTNHTAVSSALEAARKAVESAATISARPDEERWNIDSITQSSADTAFEDAKKLLRIGLKAYSAEARAGKLDVEMSAAVQEDQDRLSLLKAKCDGKMVSPASVDTISVAIKRVGGLLSSSKIETPQDVRGDTTMRTILWREREKNDSAVVGIHLSGSGPNTLLDLGKTLKEVSAGANKVTLSFV